MEGEMSRIPNLNVLILSLFLAMHIGSNPVYGQAAGRGEDLDKQVEQFLASHQNSWRDLNVPESDGQLLHDLIIKHHYTSALEIGTSTGHSGIWIAWALSKTGGKLITIEIDESRYRTALANFEEAGLSAYIDARLADAHKLVPELEGPFDFVFSDADKNWYTNYAKAVIPKLEVNGCLAAHNVAGSGRRQRGIGEFVDYITSLPNVETTFGGPGGRSSLSISIKKSK